MKKSILFISFATLVLSIIFITPVNASSSKIFNNEAKTNIITTTYYDINDEIVKIEDKIVDDEELALYLKSYSEEKRMVIPTAENSLARDVGWPASYKSEAKQINLDYFRRSGDSTHAYIFGMVEWFTVPNVQQFDVLGIRWDGNATITNAKGRQSAVRNSQKISTDYNYKGNNMNVQSNGAGLSMNLYDNASNYHLQFLIEIIPTSVSKVYFSYQHAVTNNITLAQSKSYTLSSSGLGNVIKFNSKTTENKYDKMRGISYSYLLTYNVPDFDNMLFSY